MKIDDCTSEDVHTVGGGETPPCAGLTPNALPEAQSTISAVSSHTGVSTRNVHTGLPNIFFAFGTEEQIKTFVYDNVNLPYLRFYYRHKHIGNRIIKLPLIVPNYQMESLKIICAAEASDIVISLSSVSNFQAGQMVRVIEGTFKGVIGRVKRWQGQQRVGVIIGDMATFATAYVPSAFLENI